VGGGGVRRKAGVGGVRREGREGGGGEELMIFVLPNISAIASK
jgi:hypothetical protein